eukprot:CAMPEP_0181119260 /NCGR_PEP_ID=MMETSP1071-20121207/23514_1 /TAXON_ID=35127 /ORGANISM="Thalassiosira sp., Strain NH16" /LENGTH=1254 /DNA_ID=CAMNT_0023203809 /DNA_START=174 /DNA_END=3935 /DNA_ORIENTATION=-
MGKLKQQFEEPDWCPPPQQKHQRQQQQQFQIRGQAENREPYWGGNARGENTILANERDTQMPVSNYQYSATVGGGQTLSPQQHQYQPMPLSLPQQQHRSNRDMASYLAAIKAVNVSMTSDGHGGVTALRGLWKVFDAAVTELGVELNDSLSNKAIFEANVTQEAWARQGKKRSEFEKQSDAVSRKNHYEAELKSTMLRLRGTFADVILGTKKELQNSIDKSFAMQSTELEKSFDLRLKEKERSFGKVTVDLEKKAISAAIETEQYFAEQLKEKDQSFAMKIAEMENSFAKKKAEMKKSFAMQLKGKEDKFSKKIESNRDSANIEIARLYNELKKAENATDMVNAQTRESEQAVNMIRSQLAHERETHHQAIANIEKSRDDAVTKLSSTLETLQNTSVAVNSLEVKLHDTETKLHQMVERVQYVERERHQEKTAADQQWSMANERAGILQTKYDSEVKNKSALINVQKELEKHLGLERERSALLQQNLDTETRSKQEVVTSLQEAERLRREELDRAYQANMHLKRRQEQSQSELDGVSNENMHLKSRQEQLQSELDGASKEITHLKAQQEELQSRLNVASEDNMHFKNGQEQLRSRLDRASEDNMHLHEQLKRANEAMSQLKEKMAKLQEKFEEQVGALQGSKSEYSQLTSEFQACKNRLTKMTEMNSLLEAKVDRLEAKVQDQVMDLEAARMSEADVERSLSESLQSISELQKRVEEQEEKKRHIEMEMQQRVDALEAKLQQTVCEMHTMSQDLSGEIRQKEETCVALEGANTELGKRGRLITELESALEERREHMQRAEADHEKLHKLNIELESETRALKEHTQRAEVDHGRLRKLNVELRCEKEALKEKLRKTEDDRVRIANDYSQDRDKIATALAGFDKEILNAEAKLKNVMEINIELESQRQDLETKLRKTENQLTSEKEELETRVNETENLLASGKEALETKLRKAEQNEIVVLAELAQEKIKVVNAESKNESLERKVQKLAKAQDKATSDTSTGKETIEMETEADKKHLRELKQMADDKENMVRNIDQITRERDEAKTKVSKYESDIEVYEEAIKMLQKQVEILQGLVDADCEKGAEEAIYEEQLKEEARHELLARMNLQKIEHDSAMVNKNADIADLREKCRRREESMQDLEKLCAMARKDLAKLRDEKSFLEGSLERSLRYIHDLKHQSSDAGEMNAIEVVAASPISHRNEKSQITFKDDVLDDICNPIMGSSPDLKVPGALKDIGSELDTLLTSIEAQLGVGQRW